MQHNHSDVIKETIKFHSKEILRLYKNSVVSLVIGILAVIYFLTYKHQILATIILVFEVWLARHLYKTARQSSGELEEKILAIYRTNMPSQENSEFGELFPESTRGEPPGEKPPQKKEFLM